MAAMIALNLTTRPHDLHEGDAVEFELAAATRGALDGLPRWKDDKDRGPSGEWCEGRVSSATSGGDLEVEYTNPVSGRWEVWPFAASGFDQRRPGWVRRREGAGAPTAPRCECGAWAVYGRGAGPHSSWCPLFEDEKGRA
jgi:hypothetical protein